jgi:GT2 family glycosyltransferase
MSVATTPERPVRQEPSPRSDVPITLSVPYYSGFELFRQTLRSLAAQTHPRCRLLVCDDSPRGLDAAERAEIETLIAGAFPLRVLRNPQNLGMARTWNRCLDEADTELVTIVHNDDELTADYASKIVELATHYPSAAAVY